MKLFGKTETKITEINKIARLLPELLPGMLFERHRSSKLQSADNGQHFTVGIDGEYDTSLRTRKGVQTYSVSYNSNFNHSFTDSRGFRRNNLTGEQKVLDDRRRLQVCIDMEWGNLARDYTQRSTLHGLRYVGDGQLHITERLFWTLAFVLGVLGAGYFISALYRRWEDGPMIISVSPSATQLEDIPFPAVTICNMNGARRSIAEEILNNSNRDAEARFEKTMLMDVCGRNIINNMEVQSEEDRLDADWPMIRKFLIKVSQPCHEMLVTCKWRDEPVPCNDIFNPELTDEGMCCSFNKVNKSFIFRNPRQSADLNYTFVYPGIDWTPEKGYPPNTPSNTNPWRPWGAGRPLGLSLVLDAELHEHFCSSTASLGFKMLLHNPVETPKIRGFAYFLNPGFETRVEIIPSLTTSTKNVVDIPLDKRQCFFSSDRELRFYRTYTQRNCELECTSNRTLDKCGCVPYHLPKDVENRICGTADNDCVLKARSQTDFRLSDNDTQNDWEPPESSDCNCLSSCVTVEYGKSMTSSRLDDDFINRPALAGRDKKNMTVVHFFFLENSFTNFEKGEIFGFTDFLSNTGGLLGLFLGFSFMSAAEIIYFVTLRMFCSWSKRRQNQQGQKNRKIIPFAQ